jgi:hypothetical protein
MTRTLRLELPESVYSSLVRAAKRTGKSPEILAIHHLEAANCRQQDDPVEEFIGAFPSRAEDWVGRHDDYLGEAVAMWRTL